MALNLDVKDFSKIAEAGYTFELLLPTGEPSEAYVTVRGNLSPKVKSYSRKKAQEYLVRANMAKKRGKEPDELTFEEYDELQAENAIVRIIDWTGIQEGGEEVKFTQENARRILLQHPWISEQVIKESEEILNFRS